MNRLTNLVAKMSQRERWMVAGLLGGVVMTAAALYFFIMMANITEMETLIQDGRDGFHKIERVLPTYVKQNEANQTLLEEIKKNPVKSLRLPINRVAKKIKATKPEDMGSRRMSDVIRFTGKTRETALIKSRKKKKKKRAKGAQKELQNLYWIEEEMEFPIVTSDAAMEFLAELHGGKDLLFVNALQLVRKSNNPDDVRLTLTVGTIQYIEPTEED
jgi:hypothetical protein